MKAPAKIALVSAGYVAAFVTAAAVVAIHVATTAGPDRPASSGMFAFGDSLLFLAIFGLAAVPATGAGLFFLRPHAAFWRLLAVGAAVMAATGLAALIVCVLARTSHAGPTLHAWSQFAVLRILVTPLIGFAFFLSGAFAPLRGARIALLAAAVSEGVALAAWLIRG